MAAKRWRAWPARGLPVECARLLLGPQSHLGGPSQTGERLEQRVTEEAKDEEGLAKHASAYTCKKGRA
eukprot:9484015-Pyramimonas_sp.AAC.1